MSGAKRVARICRLATERSKRVLSLVLLIVGCVAVFTLMAPHVAAQGCAMCYQNAASSGAQGRAALRHGILILLLPALTLFSGILVLIYRRRNVAR